MVNKDEAGDIKVCVSVVIIPVYDRETVCVCVCDCTEVKHFMKPDNYKLKLCLEGSVQCKFFPDMTHVPVGCFQNHLIPNPIN